MIKPGAPVRCSDISPDNWTVGDWFYIGPTTVGVHYAENSEGDVVGWKYVEELPRVLKKGDRVLVSDESLDKLTIEGYEFDGMYGDVFMCTTAPRSDVVAWKYAIHVDDVEVNND